MNSNSLNITLNHSQAAKIRVIQESIDEPSSAAKILDGLIDVGYSNALLTLYRSERINQKSYAIGKGQLPDYLRDQMPN